MKTFEYTAIWKSKESGYQASYIYVNAETRTEAKKMIKSKCSNLAEFHLYTDCSEYLAVKKIPDNCIILWYFDEDLREKKVIL